MSEDNTDDQQPDTPKSSSEAMRQKHASEWQQAVQKARKHLFRSVLSSLITIVVCAWTLSGFTQKLNSYDRFEMQLYNAYVPIAVAVIVVSSLVIILGVVNFVVATNNLRKFRQA